MKETDLILAECEPVDLSEILGKSTFIQRIFVRFTVIPIPTEIGKLVNLRVLSFHDCALATLPKEIGDLVALETLKLSKNQLDTLPCLERLVNLQWLDLSHNRLRTINPEIGSLPMLREMCLGNNLLEYLPPLFNPKLGNLDLYNNRLTKLSIVGLPLWRLCISRNPIARVPQGLLDTCLRELEFLTTPLAADPIARSRLQFCALLAAPMSNSSDRQYLWSRNLLS